ncbi:MAG: hypothetical protein Q7R93_02925 [bacterium]|nr:hypothetical protein [bacterium]
MKKIIIGIVVIAAVIGGFVFLLAPKEIIVMDNFQVQTVTLRVAQGKLVAGPTVFPVAKGETVMIKITSDEAEEFHLHGYDKSIDLEPNTEAMLTFVADTVGRFPAELEGSKTEIFTLEVTP